MLSSLACPASDCSPDVRGVACTVRSASARPGRGSRPARASSWYRTCVNGGRAATPGASRCGRWRTPSSRSGGCGIGRSIWRRWYARTRAACSSTPRTARLPCARRMPDRCGSWFRMGRGARVFASRESSRRSRESIPRVWKLRSEGRGCGARRQQSSSVPGTRSRPRSRCSGRSRRLCSFARRFG